MLKSLTFVFLLQALSLVFAESRIKLLIPFYVDPESQNDPQYASVGAASSKITVVSIINPSDGPGDSPLPSEFVGAFKNLKITNLKSNTGSYMIGYVRTGIGARPMSEIKSDVAKYASWPASYRPNGIFFDEVGSSSNLLGFYQELYNYTKTLFGSSAKVFTNPGVNYPVTYLCSTSTKANPSNNVCTGKRATDTGVTFEDVYTNWSGYTVSSYAKSVSSSQIAMLVHSCASVSDMKKAIDKAAATNVGYVFVTNEVLPDPWGVLPSYFNDEVNYIATYG